jgi:ferredoxin
MQIIADRTVCVGAGQCVLIAGDLFDQDDEGLVLVLEPHPEAAHEPAARRAATLCPARAISVTE